MVLGLEDIQATEHKSSGRVVAKFKKVFLIPDHKNAVKGDDGVVVL